jgi:hypothetical protein
VIGAVVGASFECVADAGRWNARRDPSLAQDDTKRADPEFGIWTLTRRFASASPCQGDAICNQAK